jgi:hypothetical protein
MSMRVAISRAVGLAVLLAVSVPVSAQFGHPLKGTWTGDWSPSPGKQAHAVVEMTWDGKAIGGTINPGPNRVPIAKATLDPDTWTVHLEGDGKDAAGKAVHYVVDGKLENLGSGNRALVGTWTEGAAKGPIKLVRN